MENHENNSNLRLSDSSLVAIMLVVVKGIKEGVDISQMLRDFRFYIDPCGTINILDEE